jgi:predicted outer membrane repeat protein
MSGNVFISNNANRRGGVLYSNSSAITIEASKFRDNSATWEGGVLYSTSSTIIIEASEFHDNNAYLGGVLVSVSSTITTEGSEFCDNSASDKGGVLFSSSSTITIEASKFHDNSATIWGGVLDSRRSTITIEASKFRDNNTKGSGGVLCSSSTNITIETSGFHGNSAGSGGVLALYSIAIAIEASEFCDNYATERGGVMHSESSRTITIETSEFHGNNGTVSGGVLYSHSSNITIAGCDFTNNVSPIGAIIHAVFRTMIQHIHSFLLIDNNMADRNGVIYLFDSEFIVDDSANATFSNNLGSLVAFNSNITFAGYAAFENNQPSQTVSSDFQEGGAITLLQSNAFFEGQCNFEHNHAENGGAILSTESKLYVNGDITVAHNTATGNGGGVYLSTSELNCQQKSIFVLMNNTALHKGGGLHAISSSIKAASSFADECPIKFYTGARINIIRNAAERGGGISLVANARLFILKYNSVILNDDYYLAGTILFTANCADYGGAIHVDDDTNSGTCASNTKSECFFQVLALYDSSDSLHVQSMNFSQNHASISGSTVYGGLLDRCAVNPFAEVNKLKDSHISDGIAYFRKVSTLTYHDYYDRIREVIANLSISSDPLRVCFCFNTTDQNNDCTHQLYYTEVKN